MKLKGVEAARGVAACLVVALHATHLLVGPKFYATPPLGGLFRFGHAGVDFFFVLSGFIIFHVHRQDLQSRSPGNAWRYARKRLLRVYPTYWIVLALFGAVLIYSPYHDPAQTSIGNIVASVFLLPRLQEPILGVAWTLRHELLFYALFGLLLLNRALGLTAFATWGGLIAFNIAGTLATGRPVFTGFAGDWLFRMFNIEFFFGIAASVLLARGITGRPLTCLALGAAIFLGAGLMESFGPSVPIEYPPRHIAYASGAALAVYGLATGERAGRLFVPAILVRLGSASYSIYLTHIVSIMGMQQVLLAVRNVLPMPIDLAFAFLVVGSRGGDCVFRMDRAAASTPAAVTNADVC